MRLARCLLALGTLGVCAVAATGFAGADATGEEEFPGSAPLISDGSVEPIDGRLQEFMLLPGLTVVPFTGEVGTSAVEVAASLGPSIKSIWQYDPREQR